MPPWNRLPPLLDAEIQASIASGMDEDTGKYAELVYRDNLRDQGAAADIRRALLPGGKTMQGLTSYPDRAARERIRHRLPGREQGSRSPVRSTEIRV
jgi:hypothetical protein